MSGGSVEDGANSRPPFSAPSEERGPPTEAEEIHHRLAAHEQAGGDSEEDADHEGTNRTKEKETASAVVVERKGGR